MCVCVCVSTIHCLFSHLPHLSRRPLVHNYEPGCNGSFGCGLWVALLAAIGFVRSSTYLELPKRPKRFVNSKGAKHMSDCHHHLIPAMPSCCRSSCWKHTLVVGLGVVLFWAMIGSYVFYNTTVTIDEKGDTVRLLAWDGDMPRATTHTPTLA